MGNQISCDIGSLFIEITIKLPGSPNLYEKTRFYYSSKFDSTFYFLHYPKSKIDNFKNHELFEKLEKCDIPIQVSGITYDDYYNRLSELFDCDFTIAFEENYTKIALEHLWHYSKEKIYVLDMVNSPVPDGSILIKDEDYSKRAIEDELLYPYLLVSVKSGVSMYFVSSDRQSEKIGGSSLGLSSILGILKSDEIDDIEELFGEISDANSTTVDMTVGDIYGCAYMNLPFNLTASTCGKLKEYNQCSKNDLAKSLLFVLLFNLGQISSMHCFDLGITRVVIVGSVFVNDYVSRLMRFSFNYSSKGILELILCEHSQHLRSMGIFIADENRNSIT